MKITFVLLLSISLSAYSKGYSQNVTLTMKNVTLQKVFKEIRKQTGFSFLYTTELLNKAGTVDINVKNVPVAKAMEVCLANTSLTYVIVENTIVVKQKNTAQAQIIIPSSESEADIKISGKVMDSDGKPLQGVSVALKGSAKGTFTDANGNFEMEIPDGSQKTLVFSFVGMETKEVNVEGKTNITVTLTAFVAQQQEVVVIGYGSQKKVNLTGSVSSISAKQIENRAASDISAVLTGQVTGLTVVQSGGNPGRGTGTLNIRGIGTLNNTDPLIIVDGIPAGTFNDINPDDVATVSVLKDAASASIYGVRAANGVILITTKRGSRNRKPTISFSHQTGFTDYISLPEKANAFELATLHNQATQNDGTPDLFTAADLEKFRNGSSPQTHADINSIDRLFKKDLWLSDNISFSGGSDRGAYNVSLGYINEDGILKQTGLKKYSIRTNLDTKISSRLSAGLNLSGTINEITDPAAGINWITHAAFREWATDALQFNDGRWANPVWSGLEHNSLAYNSSEMGKSKTYDTRIFLTGFAEYQVVKGLKLKGIASVIQDFDKTDAVIHGVDLYRIDPVTGVIASSPSSTTVNLQKGSILVDKVSRDYYNNNEKDYQLLLNYDRTFGKHAVTGLFGYEQREKRSEFSNLYRRKLLSDALDQINAADITEDYAGGNTIESRLQSLFGRVNYAYDSRYLVEFNLRRDGSSRFAKAFRTDYFPSVSAGWRIAKEKFFNVPFISDLKLRGSWGKLGNQEIGDYGFIPTYVLSGSYFFDGQEFAAITEGALANTLLTWEKTTAKNIGLDVGLFKNKLTFSADLFDKRTTDILYFLPQPAILGAPAPLSNAAAVRNRGFEINAEFRNQAKNFNYYIRANFSKVKNEITDLAGTDRPGFSVGDPISNQYGYKALGLFQSQSEINSSPDQSALGNTPKPGDVKYADLNKDGIVNANDRMNLGSRFPGINYGLSLGADYKGFDLSMVWQGVADAKIMGSGRFIQPFWFNASPLKYQLDSWTPQNTGAKYPEVSLSNQSNYLPSSFWLQSGAYLKLRNVQLGYTLPDKFTSHLKLSRARIFISGENLLTIDSFDYGFDPEDVSSGDPVSLFGGTRNYPTTKRLLAGITLTF